MGIWDRVRGALGAPPDPNPGSLETPAVMAEPGDVSGTPAVIDDGAAPSVQMSGDGHLVPAGTTMSQVLDYVQGTGSDWPFDYFAIGLGYYGRDVAVTFATLFRCVTLIAGVIAELISRSGLSVVGRDRSRVEGPRIRAILDVLTHSADGGVCPSHQLIEDVSADYLLDGNALLMPEYTATGRRLLGLRRYSSWNSDMEPTASTGVPVYRLGPTRDSPHDAVRYASARDVIHARWPMVTRGGRPRIGFARPPVQLLRPALDIGIRGDHYIRDWFSRGAQPKLHIDYGPADDGSFQLLTESQRKEYIGYIAKAIRSRMPLTTFGARSSRIDDSPQDTQAKELREFQVLEVGRFYGIPAPVLGVNVTQWGSGIEELGKMTYRWGLTQHVNRIIEALGVKLLLPGEKFMVDPTAFLRADAQALARLLLALGGDSQRAPVATREELRHLAGLPPEPEGEFVPPMKPASKNGDGSDGDDGQDGGSGRDPDPTPGFSESREDD